MHKDCDKRFFKQPEFYRLTGGNNYVRVDAEDKVTGRGKYAGDIMFPNMLTAKMVRSTRAHAKILSIDTSEAEKLPGVKAILTAKDFKWPGKLGNAEFAVEFADREVLCTDKVRRIGDDIAAVAAIDEETAQKAVDLIKVEYEDLPAVFDPFEAMEDGAPWVNGAPDTHNVGMATFRKGGTDTEEEFEKASFTYSEDYATHRMVHAAIEPHAAITYLENVEVSEQENDDIFYLPVQRVCRPNHEFRGFQGQAESGKINVGDRIITLPSNEEATVKSILIGDKKSETALAGQALTIQLDREVDVSRGCVLTTSPNLGVFREINATLLWMDDDKFITGKEYLVKLGTKKIPGIVKSIEYKIDVNTGQHIGASTIEKNEIASCKIIFSEKIVVDEFKNNKVLGEFILIDRVSHMTSACGVVDTLTKDEDKPYFENGKLKSSGSIFEELFYDIDHINITGNHEVKKTYHVGDLVPVQGESFEYPEYFDIFSTKGCLVVLVRNKMIQDIISLADYQYVGLPILDERGFEIKIKSKADFDLFVEEYEQVDMERSADFVNKWAKFETYRRIVCTNGFWVI